MRTRTRTRTCYFKILWTRTRDQGTRSLTRTLKNGRVHKTASLYKHHISFNGNKPYFSMSYTANGNGDRMVDFCCEYGLSISSTFFIHSEAKRVTWHSPDKRTKKKLDYILCEPWIRQYMLDCCVKNSVYIDSDHTLLVAKIRTPFTRQSRFRPRMLNTTTYKPDSNSLKNKTVVSKLNDDVTTLLSSSNADNDINQTCDHIFRAISSATTTNVPPKTRRECDNIWKNNEEFNVYYEQINYWKSVTGRTTSDTQKGQFWKLRKRIKKRKHE